MLRATLRSLLARKVRLLLASVAVLLGVSFVSGAFVLTDTLSGVFDHLFASIDQGTSVTVQGVSALDDSRDDREPVPQSVLDAVRRVPGVREAVGNVNEEASLILPDGKIFTKHGPPTLGVGINVGGVQEALVVREGHAPKGLGEVAIDATTVHDQHLAVGDRVGVLGQGAERKMTLVGVVAFRTTSSIGGATLLAMDDTSAQTVFGMPGLWTDISVAAEPGVSQRVLRDRITEVLPPRVEAVTEAQNSADQSKDLKQAVSFFNTFLLAFAGISLFVGAFLIFNTFSMLVAQRTRELALMRALGASRGQVTRSVLLEALVVGLISSFGGFGIGIGVADGLRSLLGALGIDLPNGATVIELRTLVVCLVTGVVVTGVAALVPARRAARVAPVQAMREAGPAEDRSLGRRSAIGGGVLVVGVVALAAGLGGKGIGLVGLGAALSFIGVTVLSPLVARPLVGVLGLPFDRLGLPGRLGRGNAIRSPRRTSATAAALMIGLALVSAISTLGASAKKSVVKIVATSLGADFIVHTSQFGDFSPDVATALTGRPGLTAVVAFRQGRARVGKAGTVDIQGVEPAQLQAVLKLTVRRGDLQGLTDGLAVSQTEAATLEVKVGDSVPVTWSRTGEHPLRVVAIYSDNQLAGDDLVSDTTFDENVTDHEVNVVAVRVAPGTAHESARRAITAALTRFPNVEVQDQRQFVKSQGEQVDSLLNAITVLLVLSVLIAVLGIINTLALSVVERTRELGLLRAIGLQRRQVKRMIRVESVLIAVYGAVLGIAVGVAFGFALVSALHDQGVTEFAVPGGRILEVLVVAVIGGVLAAALPARRAARMNVLEAVSSV